MDSTLKQRLIGAAVLALVAMAILPGLLARPDVKDPDASDVPLDMPKAPDQKFETRELPLAAPDAQTPPGGVLGMPGEKTAAPPEISEPVAESAVPAGESSAEVPAEASVAKPLSPGMSEAGTPSAPTPTPAPAAPTPVAKPPVDNAPATAAGNYVVNIGSFGNLTNANALVTKLRAAKLPVIAERVESNGNTMMRVRLGPYADRTTAEAARLRADGISGGTSKVVTLDTAPAPVAAKPVAVPPKPAATTAAKPASTPPATVSSGFAVQLAAPAEEAAATSLRDRARAAGFSSFVQRIETDSGVRYRVRVGPVADREAATSLRGELSQKLGINGNIVSHP
ncbi:SPOR domain-containing protein [Arenimonas sp.]|uniref:SPOR domain-containing protein n=1 Tax=Arenimonas sp. TaxID=1872635 RepID=UPI0039E23679